MRNTRIGTVILALIAVFAMSAVAASAAELEQSPSSGKFKVESKGGSFETTKGEVIKCSSVKGEGELTGAKTSKSKVSFEGCKAKEIIEVSCSTKGAKSGVIETEITSELVWLNKSKKEAGEDLVLTKELEITCSIVKIKVKGSTICPVSPVNTKTTKIELTCKQSKGKQEFTEYENEKGEKKKDITESSKSGGAFVESGLESTETLTLEKEGELIVT